MQIPDEDYVKPVPGKKNTKRWCKGKVGREHTLVIREFDPRYPGARCKEFSSTSRAFMFCFEQEYCTTCGKITRWSLMDDCRLRSVE